MQTVLESLECSYINILNLESEANRNGDTYVREEIYELADRVVWRNPGQQLVLVHPAKGQLVARHLHPNRVNRVCRYSLDIGHDNTLILAECDGVLLLLTAGDLEFNRNHVGHGHFIRLLSDNDKRVARHYEVIVLRVVVSSVERNGVKLLLGQVPRVWRNRPAIITRCTQQQMIDNKR